MPDTGTGLLRRRPRFLGYVIAASLSAIGDQLSLLVVGLYLYDRTGNIGWLAVLWAGKALGRLLLQPFAGAIVDRRPLRTVLVATAAAQTGIAAAMAVTFDADHVVLVALVIAAQLVQIFDGPAVGKAVPRLLEPADLVRGNALLRAGLTTGAVVGPALAGVLYQLTGPAWLFAANAASFAVGLAAVLWIRLAPAPPADRSTGLLRSVGQGVRYTVARPTLLVILVLVLLDSAVWRTVEIITVPAGTELFGFGPSGLGLAFALLTAGGLTGAALCVRFPAAGVSVRRAAAVYSLVGLPLLAVVAVPTGIVVLVAFFLAGLLLEVFGIGTKSYLQRVTDQAYLGRMFALYGSCLALGALPAALGVDTLVDLVGLRGGFGVAAAVTLVTGGAALVAVNLLTRRDTDDRAPEPLSP